MALGQIQKLSGAVFPRTGLGKQFQVDSLKVGIYRDAHLMGQAAADLVMMEMIGPRLHQKPEINQNLPAAPSMFTFYEALRRTQNLPWDRTNISHMDEFPVRFGSPLSFSSMIQRRLVRFLEPAPRNFFRINGAAPFLRAGADYRRIFVESTDDTVAQAYLENSVREYSEILAAHPTDIQVLGIGWNGHVAFNDPYVVGKTPASLMAYRANFGDPHLVKAVKLDDVCYEQQKAAYPGQTIPRWAISLTVPALIKAPVAFCIVPYEVKAEAVEKTIFNDVSEACPATVLRNHPNAYLFLDMASASRIWDRVKGI